MLKNHTGILLVAAGLLCGGCHRAKEAPALQRPASRTAASSTAETREETIVVVAALNTRTAGIQFMAMIEKQSVEPYVVSIVRRTEVFNAAVATLSRSPETEHVTTNWLHTHILVSTPDPDTTCIGLNTTEALQATAISIVDAVADAFVTLERDRVRREVDRMRQVMQKRFGSNPSPKEVLMQQAWQDMLASGVFETMPTIISSAHVKQP